MKTFHHVPIFLLLAFCFQIHQADAQKVKTGLEVLQKNNFFLLKGKKVGLITNPTGIDRNLQSTVDIFHNCPDFELVALFGPEHGVRGDYGAGDYVENYTDPHTGLPVYSIYGKTRKPTREMLQGIDVLVYDIQDIGSRSYTYISTLGLAMEAAAENNIQFVVLDRPNPLGGIKMEGLLTQPEFVSFVSQFPIPYVHGLTVGELALYLNSEGLLSEGVVCDLAVVAMKGWKRKMTFNKTGLPWVLTSPHIPHEFSPWFYPVSGILGELYVMSIGVGYTLPFQLFAAEWVEAEKLTAALNGLTLPGVSFRPVHFTPYYSTGKGTILHGVQLHITDFEKANLSLVQFYVIQECYKLYPDKNLFDMCNPSRLGMFDKVCGSDIIRKTFTQNFQVADIETLWMQEIPAFREKVKRYMLYK
ncbi:MAG TPA: DUF1343 domain-containing protein [Prolixibacteraceae bacterium]|nr:DUF1343 domain-containing protein [Prolixibacteraceae bacterium]HOR99348.1 DUF1343 domain-containing protein [Prolixibacteraceae bacterium]HOS90694.1 DUF1343 domain-containing protein [Prolixibacteraceae bacterium]HPL44490.1 DUF1343 domain-containing protein [Prolixibacteraceae bacterium]HQE51079.1 DUF1343 domain-containing protein [Prolixibacteraceae bacterium]